MSAKIPLERPALPALPSRLDWPGHAIAVFGPGAAEWAGALREALTDARVDAHVARVELRHAEGYALEEREGSLAIHTHPDALVEALGAARERTDGPAITIGVGAAFAATVDADLSVWIHGGATMLSLPAALRPVAREAALVLEEPREGVARSLAHRLRGW